VGQAGSLLAGWQPASCFVQSNVTLTGQQTPDGPRILKKLRMAGIELSPTVFDERL
jgi:hypothetical protein